MSRLKFISLIVVSLLSLPVQAALKATLDYEVTLHENSNVADVIIRLKPAQAVNYISFDLKKTQYSEFATTGEWQVEPDQAVGVWRPLDHRESVLRYRVQLDQSVGKESYLGYVSPQWALFQGEQLVPEGQLHLRDDVSLRSRVQFTLPEGWSVETGWRRIGTDRFLVDDPERTFDRPEGWILAGKLGTRRARLGNTDVSISAPVGEGVDRMDMLTLLSYVWPQLRAVFPREISKLLVVSTGSPFWRGSLSSSNTMYLHAGLPMVTGSGTSPLLRELVEVFAQIHTADRSVWINEGIAEYYSMALLHRSGGLSDERYEKALRKLKKTSADVTTLRGEQLSRQQVARAVVLLDQLNREIEEKTREKSSIDTVVQALMRLDSVTTNDFKVVVEAVIGGPSAVLDSSLLR